MFGIIRPCLVTDDPERDWPVVRAGERRRMEVYSRFREEAGGHGTWVDALGLEFVATSSGAMVLTTKPGSIAAAKGIQSGDFIEWVDGVPIKTLDAEHMAARIGAPGVRVLHMIVAGDVKLR